MTDWWWNSKNIGLFLQFLYLRSFLEAMPGVGLVLVKPRPPSRERGKDVSLDKCWQLQLASHLGFQIRNKNSGHLEEEDKHLEKLGYQQTRLCNRNLEISLEIQFSWNFTQSCLRNEDSRRATNCQIWHPSESTPSVGDRKSGQIKSYLALDVDFYIFICEWFHGKMVFTAL